jgi:hypothetical protein
VKTYTADDRTRATLALAAAQNALYSNARAVTAAEVRMREEIGCPDSEDAIRGLYTARARLDEAAVAFASAKALRDAIEAADEKAEAKALEAM